MAEVNNELALLITTRVSQANAWLADGHRLVTVEGIAEPDRLPSPEESWHPDREQRHGPWYARKRVCYIFLRGTEPVGS